MFVETVMKMEIDNRIEKTILTEMARTFEGHLPESLYMNHYQLSETFGYEPKQWRDFLKNKEIERLVEAELGIIAEAAARNALASLQSGKASSSDVQAARELLANSKLLQQKHNQKPIVVVTRIPAKENIDG